MTAKGRLIRNIIIAAAAIAVLGGGYYFALNWEPSQKEEEAPTTAPSEIMYIISEDAEGVNNIHIKNDASEYDIIRTQNSDGENVYSIPTLTQGDADNSAIESAFASLIRMSAMKKITSGAADAASFGLTETAARYIVSKTDGSSITVIVGDEVPTGGEFYCMTEGGDTVYTLSSYKAEIVQKIPEDYRKRVLLNISDTSTVTSFSLYRGAEKIIALRAATEEENSQKLMGTMWAMDYPWNEEVSDEKIKSLLEGFAKIEATGFATASEASGFDFRFEISAGEETHSFSIGRAAADGGVYLRNEASGIVYIVDEAIRKTAESINPNDYTSKLVKVASIDKVSRVVIRSGDTEYTMEPGNDDGKPYVICGKEVEEKYFKTTYQSVIGIMYRERGSFKTSGEPRMTITYEFTDGTSDTTKYFEYDERNLVALRSDGTTVKIVASAVSEVENLIQKQQGE